MPKIFEWKGCKFFFYANEGEPVESCLIHVRKGEHTANFWISPEITLASSYGFSGKELNDLAAIIQEQKEMIRRKWNDFFEHRS